MLNAADRVTGLETRIAAAIRDRGPLVREFFAADAGPIAHAACEIAERLDAGARIYAFGLGPYATDAQHVAVEFVHPVLVGKPALPASDLSASFEASLPALVDARDIVIGFAPPDGEPVIDLAIALAQTRGAYTIGLPARGANFSIPFTSDDEHVHQEIVEIVCHVLYESVHVFLEHRRLDGDAGPSAFLYPFLGGGAPDARALTLDVTRSIVQKANDGEALRERVAREQTAVIAGAAQTIARECAAGGRLLLFGNGGSATDANDWALDCVMPPGGLAPVPALSLALEPATILAIANDVGREFIFARQLIAHARPHDVAIALSTSGGSSNVIMGLEEARKRGHHTIALLGYDGGEILRRGLADHTIVVDCDYIPRVQEAHATIYHVLRHAIDWAVHDA
jgi:D-sedoheptulose 7-phosphate isomerase